jgi:hypothetical protein
VSLGLDLRFVLIFSGWLVLLDFSFMMGSLVGGVFARTVGGSAHLKPVLLLRDMLLVNCKVPEVCSLTVALV